MIVLLYHGRASVYTSLVKNTACAVETPVIPLTSRHTTVKYEKAIMNYRLFISIISYLLAVIAASVSVSIRHPTPFFSRVYHFVVDRIFHASFKLGMKINYQTARYQLSAIYWL